MDFKNLNKTNPFTFDVPEGTEFKNLKELNPAYVYTLLTVHMNTKGKFGEYAIGAVVCDDTGEINWVSFPSHLNDVFTDITSANSVLPVFLARNTTKLDTVLSSCNIVK